MTRAFPAMAGAMLLGLAIGISTTAARAAQPADPGTPFAAPFAAAAVVDEATLAAATGRADIKVAQQNINVQNNSNVAGNSINGDFTTGLISIGGGAFDGFNGLALLNFNSGNNVAINASMNVNVAFQQ